MNIANYTIAAIAIFGLGLFFGCIITAKSLELGTQPEIEVPFGVATFAIPVMPPFPKYATRKLAKNAK